MITFAPVFHKNKHKSAFTTAWHNLLSRLFVCFPKIDYQFVKVWYRLLSHLLICQHKIDRRSILNYPLSIIHYPFGILLAIFLLTSCSAEKFIAEKEYILDKVEIKTESKDIDVSMLRQYIKQSDNSKWFSLFKIPMATYSLAGSDTTKWINRTLRNIGEKPVVFDSTLAKQSVRDLQAALQRMGYMKAKVNLDTKVKGKKLKATYTLHPGEPFHIGNMRYIIEDSCIAAIPGITGEQTGLKTGTPFNTSTLDAERARITQLLQSNGYLRFNKHFIQYEADSVNNNYIINLTLRLLKYRERSEDPETNHPRYRIGEITFLSDTGRTVPIRKRILQDMTMLEPGELYDTRKLQRTYSNFGRMGIVKYTNIKLNEREGVFTDDGSRILDPVIQLGTKPVNTISFQPEGTNTAGDLGAAVVLSYENRNVFHGSELFSIEGRAAYEAITGLSGYDDSNYLEFGLGASLQFPRFLLPFIKEAYRKRVNASSEVALRWDMQNRPEFQRRVLTAAWRYKWTDRMAKSTYQFDLIDINYIRMPWISETFRTEYLDNTTSSNSILRFNYQDLFITKIGFKWHYNGNSAVVRTNVETSGNILSGAAALMKAKKNERGEYTLCNIAFAQYVKGDISYTKLLRFDTRNTLALHAAFGIAYPYGNSTILPFEKRYFSGGANSLRGWSVRSIGPGKYKSKDGAIDFINQTGDMKIDLNAEWRTKLFWKFAGAFFIDAGNIWTLRNYEEQEGGQFKFNTFLSQLAASYGLGIRLDFNYFIIRFDMGMKAVNPAYETNEEHWPIIHPKLSRDFAFHFAVGMPF